MMDTEHIDDLNGEIAALRLTVLRGQVMLVRRSGHCRPSAIAARPA
jgi:hypothetical protein